MKNWFIVALVIVSVTFSSVSSGLAQDPQTDDQKTEALLKKNAELKRKLREEIEKQNKLLQDQIDQVTRETADLKAKASPATPSSKPATRNVAGANGNDGGNDGAVADGSAGTADGGNRAGSTGATAAAPAGDPAPAPAIANAAAPQTAASPINGNCLTVFMATQKPNRLDQAKCFLARAMIFDTANRGIDLTGPSEGFFLMVLLGQLAKSGKVNIAADAKAFVLDIEASRADKQFGADPKSSGTTSLAVKGGIPSVLSWAVENGAAVASSSGTSYTFRINPVGLAQAFSGTGYISGFQETENDAMASFFRKTSVGFTFDTARGTSPPTLIGSKQQLSAVSLRYNFINERDPRAKRYQKLWDAFFEKEGLTFTLEESNQLKALEIPPDPTNPTTITNPEFKNRDLQKWINDFNTAYAAQASQLRGSLATDVTDRMVAFIDQRIASLPLDKLGQDPAVVSALTKFAQAYLPYLKAKKKIMDEVAKGTLATFEYTNFREQNAPDLSNFRFIAEKGTLGGVDLTANASLTFFNKTPVGPGVQRIRDFDFSGQFDKKLPDFGGLGPATLSFTGKYQRLTSNVTALDGTVLPNTKGDIAAGQIKFLIPLKDSGFKIPFSVTFANRTELVREREVRGNFGFSLDLDTLFAKYKPF